jgi:hypothetical protein
MAQIMRLRWPYRKQTAINHEAKSLINQMLKYEIRKQNNID